MARTIVVSHGSEESSFTFSKLDRGRLYGTRKRVVLDRDGQPCRRAELTDDGAHVLQAGMTAQGYFDDGGAWVPNADLVGLEADGTPAPVYPATIGVAQPLEGPVAPEDVLDVRVQSTYVLEPEQLSDELAAALAAGDIFRFRFGYRTDHREQVAFLLGNDEGLFALVGAPAPPAWCELADVLPIGTEDDADTDDLDFEMF